MNKLLDFLKRHLFAVGIVCLLAVSGAVAAPNVARLFTSIIIRPDVGGTYTGFSGTVVMTNANGGGFRTNTYHGGFLVRTNS
jgi:hypothetical protein